jgi:hypothetical protein
MSPSASTRHQPLATRHSGCAAIPLPANPVLLSKMFSELEIHHPKSKIFLPPIHPVAVFATTLGSGFVEMILHLPIQNHPHSLPATSYSLLS